MAFFLRSLFSDSSSQQTKPPTEQTTFAPIPQLLVDNNGIPSPHRSTLFRAGGSENSLRHFNNTDMAASQQTRAARKQVESLSLPSALIISSLLTLLFSLQRKHPPHRHDFPRFVFAGLLVDLMNFSHNSFSAPNNNSMCK